MTFKNFLKKLKKVFIEAADYLFFHSLSFKKLKNGEVKNMSSFPLSS